MARRSFLMVVAAVSYGAHTASADGVSPDTTDPKVIMKAVEDRDLGERMVANAEMTITDSSNRTRTLSFKTSFIENRTDGKRTMRKRLSQFTGPADVAATGLLTYDADDPKADDPQWVYLPRLRKSKRIASSDRANAWMGSDFSYSDLGRHEPDDYDFKLEKASVNVGGEPCWLIEATPRSDRAKEDTGYTKIEWWVSKDKLLAVQAKAYMKKGQKVKLIKADDNKKVDGVWITYKYAARTMNGTKAESTTTVTLKDVKVKDAKVDDADFTTAHMERGL